MRATLLLALICGAAAFNGTATIPQDDHNTPARVKSVADRHAGFVYGPSLIGHASFFPNGTLGNARTKADYALWMKDREVIDKAMQADAVQTGKAIAANGGLKSLDDYVRVLYQNEWVNSNPIGEAPGIMTNYTQDLLFSMERLSQNSFPLKLVKPEEKVPFPLADELAVKITGVTLEALHKANHLFVVDHIWQNKLDKTTVAPPRFGAACTAYFYIHPKSGDFLPLAIKTNVGSNLIYTPLDSDKDWLLAKMMFNVNDMFHAQMFHLVVTHDVSEGVHLAALRTLHESHPVMVILERLMIQGYSSRIVGEELCFNPGGHWDQLMLINNVGCRQYVTDTWPKEGSYQSAYIERDLQTRGLIDKAGKFPFKSFPFYQDAIEIQKSFKAFFTAFVDSYYPSEAVMSADGELQNWFTEVTKGAQVHDFPQCGAGSKPCNKQTLVDVLTHFGFIVSVVHHSLNGGDPIGSKATLPFHLNAMYAPVPTAKGVKDLLPFLPPPQQAVHYIGFIATFNRPFYRTTDRTLDHFVTDATLLNSLNAKTKAAAATFTASMKQLSTTIRGRKFDSHGLSTGMPFVYRTLDPGYIPFFSSV